MDIKNIITLVVVIISLFLIPKNILFAILVFGILVLVHEFGHYIIAVKSGIFVEEFAIGMGPKLFSFKKRASLYKNVEKKENDDKLNRDTVYSVRVLPLGGYCKMLGEDEECNDENAFNNKPVLARMATIFAGPFFNFVFAFIAAILFVGMVGYGTTTIDGFIDNSAAKKAGFKKGDVIYKINDNKTYINDDIFIELFKSKGKSVEIEYKRDGAINKKLFTPMNVDGNYSMGITIRAKRVNFLESFKIGYYKLRNLVNQQVLTFSMLFKGQVKKEQVSGPVGIVNLINQGYTTNSKYGLEGIAKVFLHFVMFLSFNLGVVNLFPIPALDGGRLVFLLIEAIRRKPLNREVEGVIHLVGLGLLMVLMVFLLFNDIGNIFMSK